MRNNQTASLLASLHSYKLVYLQAKIILMVLSFASPLMQDLDVTMANGHETHSSTVVKQQMNTIEDNLRKITWDI